MGTGTASSGRCSSSTLSDFRPESAAPSGDPHSPNPLSPIPPRPDGRERAPEPIFERISPSSPVRSGGRMGEEGWGDEGQRTEDAKSDKVEVGSRYNRAGHVLAGNLTPAGTVE